MEFWIYLEFSESVKSGHNHSKNTGLETHEKVFLYVFVHVFFVGMCTVLRSRHMGKPNLNNASLRSNVVGLFCDAG